MTAHLSVRDRNLDLPLVESTEGNLGVSISGLRKETGAVTFDPGFMNTAPTTSAITFIDGEAGILRHRGYPIEQLAEHSSYLEVAFLLIFGELPTKGQLDQFVHSIEQRTLLDENLKRVFIALPRDAAPMAVLQAGVSALSTFYQDSLDPNDPEQVRISTMRLLAKMPTMAAYAHRVANGQPLMYPDNSLSLVQNFLRLMFAFPVEDFVADPVVVRALEQLFILHADHEQNASTSTVRIAGSSGANPFACIAAGIACLWGPAHGGANEAALNMLYGIGKVENIPDFIAKVKDKNSEVRLMGFGHRVYKNYDPRAKIMQKMCHAVLKETGHGDDPMLKVAMELERIALSDPYFIDRKLYPNVDFYSGVILSAIGFPTEMFTVLFAVARTVGWISQWSEMIEDPQQKIGRPRQLYTGVARRDYVQIDKRT